MAPTDSARNPIEPLFPQLSGGPHRMAPAAVARHQKTRLEGAMVEAVSRHGFAATTLRELVTLAGVSKTTFYEHFASKEALFLATFDEIVVQVAERVGKAWREPGDFREKLTRALRCFMQIAVEEQAAAWLTAVESLTLGKAGVAHREAGSESFELMVRQSFDSSPSKVEVSEMTVRAIVAGIRGVLYRRLRAHEAEKLPDLVEELVDWALSYQREPSAVVRRALAAAGREPDAREGAEQRAEAGEEETVPWEEPPDSDRSRHNLTQRERITRAAAHVVVDRGFEALSIPAISAAAGTSNQTFYENFKSKTDAFLAAFEEMAETVLRVSAAAFTAEGDDPAAVGAGLRTLLEFTASNELFARLSFYELPTAGPVALDRADRTIDAFGAYLKPELAPSALAKEMPPATLEAILSGTWAVIQHEITHGRRESLPERAPDIAWIALGPFSG